MYKKLKECIFSLSLLLFASCSIDNILNPKFPIFSVDYDIPLSETIIKLKDIILDMDSSITVFPDLDTVDEFDSVFVYQLKEKIDPTFIDDKLNIQNAIDTTITQSVDDISIENILLTEIINFSDVGIEPVSSALSTEIGLIVLDDIKEEDSNPYTFENLLPDFYNNINAFLDNSGDSGLGNAPYDANQIGSSIGNEPIIPTLNEIEFSSFEYANFNSGTMNININNSLMYLNFESMTIELQDGYVGNVLDVIDIGFMESGQIYNEVINLGNLPNNGFLSNRINLKISGTVSGISDGTTYNQLLNSQIGIGVSAIDLEVIEASAEVPEQNFNDNGSFDLDSENKILEATINSGYLLIELVNNLPSDLDGNIDINIPNIINPSNNPLSISFNLSGEVDGIDLSQHKIVIDDITNQQILYNYLVSTSDSQDYVVINQSDNIDINFKLVGDLIDNNQQITLSSINGIIESQDSNLTGDVDLEVDGATIQSAIFGSGEIVMEIINNISNAPLNIEITIDGISFGGQAFTETIILSGSHNETFSLSDYTLTPTYYDASPNIFYNVIATNSNQLESQYNLNNDITVNLSIQNIDIKEVTGYFNQDPIIETNSVNVDSENVIEQGHLESGNIEIEINNNLGLNADVNFRINQIFDGDGNVFDYTIDLNEAEAVANIDLSNHTIHLIDDVNSDLYQQISYASEVIINSDELSTLNLENNIEISFRIPELTFSYIKGDIAPVEVEITPFSQTDLDILPDNIQGINFNKAIAYLDFESELDLGLLLQLDFYATNSSSDEEYVFQFTEETSTLIDRVYLNSDDILSMINIIPDSMSVSGLATVSGTGEINSSDAIAAEFTIEVPFEFMFTDDSNIEMAASNLSDDSIPDQLESMTVYYEYKTPFNFNTNLSVFCADDSVTIVNDLNKFIDVALLPTNNVSKIDSLVISSDKFDLFSSSNFMKPIINIISLTDSNGDLIPQSFYSTDSLTIKLWANIGVLVNGNE